MKSKELRAKRAKLIEDARAFYNAAVTAGTPSAEDDVKFEAMMAEADGLKGQIDRIERADEAFNAQMEDLRARNNGSVDPDQEKERARLENRVYHTWARHGASALNAEEREIYTRRYSGDGPRNAMGTTPDPAGGYAIPEGPMQALVQAQLAYGGMLGVGDVFDTTGGNELPIPTSNDTGNKGGLIGENTQAGQQDIALGNVKLNAYTFTSKIVLVSNQLIQDAAWNIDAFVTGTLGIRIARGLNDYLTTGNGASQPTGILTAATLGYTAGGSTTSGETATVTFDDLMELEHSVDPSYRQNAQFMFADSTLKVIKKLKDGLGRPLWLPGLAVKEPDTINQYPYSINQSMPAMAASAKSILFGDFKNYRIRRVAGVQVMRLVERYADFNQVGFVAFQRWDGNLVDAGTHPVKYLQNSAT